MVERALSMREVEGSIPSSSTKQICPSWSKGFDLSSDVARLVGSNPTICNAFIAQLVEHYTCNVKVSGSNPDEGY